MDVRASTTRPKTVATPVTRRSEEVNAPSRERAGDVRDCEVPLGRGELAPENRRRGFWAAGSRAPAGKPLAVGTGSKAKATSSGSMKEPDEPQGRRGSSFISSLS